MWLLNTKSLTLKAFIGSNIPDYIILSHTWGNDEVLFDETRGGSLSNNSSVSSKAGYIKVKGTCDEARRNGYDWVWIDSLCINKNSSAELQEAINSMWNWYQRANVCYVFLDDTGHEDLVPGRDDKIRWFSRGWTLQELLAPPLIHFYNQNWIFMGTKISLVNQLETMTGINQRSLIQGDMRRHNGAEKMSWVAHREVTREEDMAYSLMGLFNVNMPLLYGEGGTKAFARLQEQIMQGEVDHTLFLYRYRPAQEISKFADLMAHHPSQFCQQLDCSLHTDEDETTGTKPAFLDYSSLVLGEQSFNAVSEVFWQNNTAVTTSFKVTSPVALDTITGNVINGGFLNSPYRRVRKPPLLSHAKNLPKRLAVIHLRVWSQSSQLCLLLLNMDKSGCSTTYRRLHSDVIHWTVKSSISDETSNVHVLHNSTLLRSRLAEFKVLVSLNGDSWNIIETKSNLLSTVLQTDSTFTVSAWTSVSTFALLIRDNDRHGFKVIQFKFVMTESGIGSCAMIARSDDSDKSCWKTVSNSGTQDSRVVFTDYTDYTELLPHSGAVTKPLVILLSCLPTERQEEDFQEFHYCLDIKEKD
jgi:hypothetical protein